MDEGWKVFVEGKGDRSLVRCLLGYLGIDNVSVEYIDGGVTHLGHVAPQILRSRDAGHRIALVLDANSDPQRRQAQMQREIRKHQLPIERSFLLPDNTGPGCLETLLVEMAVSKHRAIYDCFDAYERCLQRFNAGYRTPNGKARVYAYCEALAIATGADKDYGDTAYWNLNVPRLAPLKQFLADLVA